MQNVTCDGNGIWNQLPNCTGMYSILWTLFSVSQYSFNFQFTLRDMTFKRHIFKLCYAAVVCEFDPNSVADLRNPADPFETEVPYGSGTSIICNVDGVGMFERPVTCAFNPITGIYELMGSSWECGG